jgi:hypothetical protein
MTDGCGMFSNAFQLFRKEHARAVASAIAACELGGALPVCLCEVVLAFLTPTSVAFARVAFPALDEPKWIGWNIYFSRRESPDECIAVRFVSHSLASPFVVWISTHELDDLPPLVVRLRALCDGANCHLERTLISRLRNYLNEVGVYNICSV